MSDTKEEIPRLHFEEDDTPRLIEVIQDLYLDVLRIFNHNPGFTPEEVLERVAKRWIADNQGPFMLILIHWSATALTPPQIWEEPTTSYDDEDFNRPVFSKSWRLKPRETIDLRLSSFGGGEGFFGCFELRVAISEAQYDDLVAKFRERDEQLAAKAS